MHHVFLHGFSEGGARRLSTEQRLIRCVSPHKKKEDHLCLLGKHNLLGVIRSHRQMTPAEVI